MPAVVYAGSGDLSLAGVEPVETDVIGSGVDLHNLFDESIETTVVIDCDSLHDLTAGPKTRKMEVIENEKFS